MADGKIIRPIQPNQFVIYNWRQNNTAHTITFSGTARTRCIYGQLWVVGQDGISENFAIAFYGASSGGSEYDRTTFSRVYLDHTNTSVSQSGSSINIAANINNGWGTITLILFYNDPSLIVTHTT